MKVTVTINDTDQLLMKNDLTDIKEWVTGATTGKINNCWKRFRTEWTTRLMDDDSFTDPIPSNKDAFVALVVARDDYQDRVAREAS